MSVKRRPAPLYRIRAECPACGTPPFEDITARERARYAEDDPALPVRRVKCWRRGCGQRYWISAGAYQDAA